jgi:Uma2 family endonuclease
MTTTSTASNLLTYEQYMAEGEVEGRYDIVEGMRIFMPGPTWQHQRILVNILLILHRFEVTHGIGFALTAPFDILIRRRPRLQTRQPDLLFISKAALGRVGGAPQKGPLEVAPELVVEILSDSERDQMFEAKLADYTAIGVQECWRVLPRMSAVDVLRLTAEGPVLVASYDASTSVQSIAFPDLITPVAEFFRP